MYKRQVPKSPFPSMREPLSTTCGERAQTRCIKRRTVANEACDAGRVMVNGKPAKASVNVKVGDVIEIAFVGL